MNKKTCFPSHKYEWLEVMRGVAAIWVVLYHSHNLGGVFFTPLINVPLVANGWLGVDFFFVLSGFIIALSSNRLIDQGRGFSSYLKSRLIRIYVPYLPIGIVIFLLYLFLPSISGAPRSIGLLSSLTLLPTNYSPALNVAWSLVHEIVFYGIFSIIFISKSLLFSVLSLWAVAIVACFLLGVEVELFYSYFLNPMNLCFLLGVIVFYVRPWTMPPLLAKVSLSVGLSVVLFSVIWGEPNRIVVPIGFAIIIASVTSAHWSKIRPFYFFGVLGSASYCIYLIHNPVLSILMRVLRWAVPDVNPWMSLFITSAVAIAAGLAYWRFYETWALKIVHRFAKASGSSEDATRPVS